MILSAGQGIGRTFTAGGRHASVSLQQSNGWFVGRAVCGHSNKKAKINHHTQTTHERNNGASQNDRVTGSG
jgi:hypothetical protein